MWLEATYNSILDENGNVYKVIKVSSDTTERVNRATATGAELKVQSKSIVNIVVAIGSIAAQTNLLALIQAAYAGEIAQGVERFVEMVDKMKP